MHAVQLKILACNVSGGELTGTIQVNRQLVHPKEFRNQSAVVWQSDVLLSSSTVRSSPSSSAFQRIMATCVSLACLSYAALRSEAVLQQGSARSAG